MAPFGFMSDGLDDDSFTDNEGDRWFKDLMSMVIEHICGSICDGC